MNPSVPQTAYNGGDTDVQLRSELQLDLAFSKPLNQPFWINDGLAVQHGDLVVFVEHVPTDLSRDQLKDILCKEFFLSASDVLDFVDLEATELRKRRAMATVAVRMKGVVSAKLPSTKVILEATTGIELYYSKQRQYSVYVTHTGGPVLPADLPGFDVRTASTDGSTLVSFDTASKRQAFISDGALLVHADALYCIDSYSRGSRHPCPAWP